MFRDYQVCHRERYTTFCHAYDCYELRNTEILNSSGRFATASWLLKKRSFSVSFRVNGYQDNENNDQNNNGLYYVLLHSSAS